MQFEVQAWPLAKSWTHKSLMIAACVLLAASPAAAAKRGKTAKALETEGPLTLMVSLKRQKVVVYDKNGPVTSAPISSGRKGHRTPTGVFSILQKRRRHYSNLYAGAAMPNMQRITWSGIALHAGPLPGYPASHGCIRLPYSFSKKLFSMTDLGTRVVVTGEQESPRSFAHANLPKPLPPGDPEAYANPASDGSNAPKGASAAQMLFGVTPANAKEHAALPSGVERTRAAVAAYRRQELLNLEATLEASKEAHVAASEDLKAANLELAEKIKAERVLKPEADAIVRRLLEAQEGLTATNRKFRDFLLRATALKDEAARSQAAKEELALEAEAIGFANETDLAKADRRALDAHLEAHRTAIEAARSRKDTLQQRYASAREALATNRERLAAAKKAQERRELPITILLTKHSGKLYVRQGYDPVYETDITFKNPEAPLGTQVFHAMDWSEDATDLVWHAVTAARTYPKKSRKSRKKGRGAELPSNWPDQTPGNALDRVEIPEAAKAIIAEHLKPGSALIVTDERKSYETGEYTDLIVLTR